MTLGTAYTTASIDYEYDDADRMTKFDHVTGTANDATYAYLPGSWRRYKRTLGGTTEYYVYDGDNVVNCYSSGGTLNACGAGATTLYSYGDSTAELADYAWFAENSGGRAHLVGTRKPNPSGLYDMHGNVWEWCSDLKAAYGPGHATDPEGVSTASARVLRGGSWHRYAEGCRTAYRGCEVPAFRHKSIGFRVARTKRN